MNLPTAAFAAAGSGPDRRAGAGMPAATLAYTPGMRRLLCVVALLQRFAGQTYVWRALPLRQPIPIEWRVAGDSIHGSTTAWWLAR